MAVRSKVAENQQFGSSTKPLRVMIVGDSMTQGGEGDWTWRYRLWDWLRSQSAPVQFVGPYEGTQDSDKASPPKPPPLHGEHEPPGDVRHHGGYAVGTSKDFDSHHFSVWGRAAAQTRDLIEDMVSEYPTDLLLVMLGFNDVGWFISDAPGTLESMNILVTKARQANPNIRFALANIPQRTYMDGREDLPIKTDEYNKLLEEAVPKWSTEQSPIHLVKLRESYVAEKASYDGLHPNSLGDYQIARAFSLTLIKDYRLGKTPLSIPDNIPPRPLPTPSNFQVVSSPVGVTATWDKVYGSYGYEIRDRLQGGEFSTGASGYNRWDSHWSSEGSVYEIQVRACYGNEARSDWTPVLSATSHPQTAAAPENLKVQPTEKGVIVNWDKPKGPNTDTIIQYSVLWHDRTTPGMFPGLRGFVEPPAKIDDLEPGHVYGVFMLTWNAAGEGLPGPAEEVTVGEC